MRELIVETRREALDGGQVLELEYAITVEPVEAEGELVCENYGIQIADRGVGGDTVVIPNVTASAQRIGALLELLARNTVTPATAMDVVRDWL